MKNDKLLIILLTASISTSMSANYVLYKKSTDLESVINTKSIMINDLNSQLEKSNNDLIETNTVLDNVLIELSHAKDKIYNLEQEQNKLKKQTASISRGNKLSNVNCVIMETTAYTHTGQPTKSGKMPKRGMVAVDTTYIPLGTKLYVEGYGYAVAEDTGSAIKGNKLDLFMDTKEECIQWGRKKVKVYIVKE